MAKNKKNKGKGTKFSKEKDGFAGAGTLGTNVKQLGTTIAGVLISEVVEAVVEKLVERFDSNQNHASAALDKGTDNTITGSITSVDTHRAGIAQPLTDTPTPLQSETNEDVKPSVQEAVEVIKETVSDFTPSLADVVNALKDRSRRSLQESFDAATSKAGLTLDTAADTAREVVQVLNTGNSSRKGKKGKKKGKKKNKDA